ncbi:MAG TPA: Mur ligase family protein, partial [Patescibacteria group bacterium]|nr:Mur ligase family protein [Patescibacteria group bacterium]
MKSLLEKLLAVLAQRIIKKYNPKIIGITGSMGKTSAKEAVFAVLKEKFQVRKNIKNYNNEIGVPLTVIGAESGGSSVFRWLLVILRAFGLLLFKKNDYPEVLVLEMGADKPGDIQYLVEKFPCDVGVLTMIGPAHLENFKTLENIVKEKQKIVTHLSKKGQAIINSDDPQQKQVKDKVEATVLTYGSSEDSDLRGADLSTVLFDSNTRGVKFKILYKGSAVPVDLPGVIGAHQINAALIGSLVGLSLELN